MGYWSGSASRITNHHSGSKAGGPGNFVRESAMESTENQPNVPPIPRDPVPTGYRPPEPDRFRVDEKIDENKVEGRSHGALLLYYREAVFDKIHRADDLPGMIRHYLLYSLLFGAIFGLSLGCHALGWQLLSSAVKIPVLLWGTLLICLPALFTFNVLLGSKLSIQQTAAVLAMSTYLLTAILVSLAPIMMFFIISTQEKEFVILLTVLSCGLAGVFGVLLLWQAMGYLTVRAGYPYDAKIIKAWTLIYVFVGTQAAWLLRPFVGDQDHFAVFRQIGGNFYNGLFHIIEEMIKG